MLLWTHTGLMLSLERCCPACGMPALQLHKLSFSKRSATAFALASLPGVIASCTSVQNRRLKAFPCVNQCAACAHRLGLQTSFVYTLFLKRTVDDGRQQNAKTLPLSISCSLNSLFISSSATMNAHPPPLPAAQLLSRLEFKEARAEAMKLVTDHLDRVFAAKDPDKKSKSQAFAARSSKV
jgi:hypothetical protein